MKKICASLLSVLAAAGVVVAAPTLIWTDEPFKRHWDCSVQPSPGAASIGDESYMAKVFPGATLNFKVDAITTGASILDVTFPYPDSVNNLSQLCASQYWFDNDPDWELSFFGNDTVNTGEEYSHQHQLYYWDNGVTTPLCKAANSIGWSTNDYRTYGFSQDGTSLYLWVQFHHYTWGFPGCDWYDNRFVYLLRSDGPTTLGMAPAILAPSIASARFASSGNLNLQMTMPVPASADFSLYNSRGCMVQRAAINSIGAGAQSISIDTKDIASGQYYLKSTIGKTASVLPVVKVK